MLRFALALFLLLIAFPASLAATERLPGSRALTEETEGQAAPTDGASVEALVEALRNEATREQIIRALEGGAGSGGESALPGRESTGRAHLPAPTVPPAPTIGDRLLETAPAIATGLLGGVQDDWKRLQATYRRLQGLDRIDPDVAREILTAIALMAVISFGTAIGGRFLMSPVFRRIGTAAKGAGSARRLMLAGLSALIELVLLGLALVATAAVLGAERTMAPGPTYPFYYLAGFLFGGLLTISLRVVVSPATSELRPVPLTDATARSVSGHFTFLFMFGALGELYFSNVVRQTAGPITASAVIVAVHVAIVLYLAVLVLAKRKVPGDWLAARAAESPQNLFLPPIARVARYWYLPALVFLALAFHRVVTSSLATIPVLYQLPGILLSLIAAAFVISRLNRAADRGLRLSEGVEAAMPNLRGQTDAFLSPFLRLMSWIVFFVWLGYVFDALELTGPRNWIEARFGVNFAGVTASLVIIVLVAYATWLAVSTWIDFRLKPVDGTGPTARQRTLFVLLRNVALVVILLTALAYTLSAFGVSVAPLLASAGVVGLAISWGSQKLVQDVITGLFIQVENVFNVGDVVEVGGKIGTVEKLTIRSVSLRDVEGVMHTLPFSSVDAVSNHMRGYSYHVADIAVAHGADLDRAKDEMLAAYEDLSGDFEWSTRLLGGVEWFGVQTLGPHSVILRARLKTRPGEQWAVGRAYAERVKRRFDAAGIEIPFPQLRLWTESDHQPAVPPAAMAPSAKRAADSPTDADLDSGAEGEGSER